MILDYEAKPLRSKDPDWLAIVCWFFGNLFILLIITLCIMLKRIVNAF